MELAEGRDDERFVSPAADSSKAWAASTSFLKIFVFLFAAKVASADAILARLPAPSVESKYILAFLTSVKITYTQVYSAIMASALAAAAHISLIVVAKGRRWLAR